MSSMDQQFRTFTPDLEIRSAAKGGDGRTVVGIAVPFGRPQRIDQSLVEQFARGSFNHQLRAANRVPFAREHMSLGGILIGRTLMLRDDASGLYGEWRVSKTPAGDETIELIRDGALQDLSIAFRERQNRRLKDGTIERVRADLREVSVVMEGAYGANAVVAEVRRRDELAACGCGDGIMIDEATRTRLREAQQVLASLPVLPA